jgi:carbonic anhydrase
MAVSDDKDTGNTATEQEKSFFERAQDAIEDAVESTVEAVKEHPLAAAAIAAGAAAAVAGAAYGASKLLDNDNEADDTAKG